jgi:ubiquinone/menaquinone biosynthesis C-methylase UbiE
MHWKAINKLLGNIDIYWLDFILKGYLSDDAKILDAGCGEGRNLFYCMQMGYDVFGVDRNPEAIQFLQILAKQFKVPDYEARFQQMDLVRLRFPDNTFDVVISSAVLHFAENQQHFLQMLSEKVRVLKPGGKLFVRSMTENHQIEEERFTINDELLAYFCKEFGLELMEPVKSVQVGKVRSMGTFFLRKI